MAIVNNLPYDSTTMLRHHPRAFGMVAVFATMLYSPTEETEEKKGLCRDALKGFYKEMGSCRDALDHVLPGQGIWQAE